MKLALSYAALLSSVLLLQACGGGGLAGDSKDSTSPLVPEPVVDDGSDRPRPSANTPVMKTDGWQVKTAEGQALLLRGVNVLYGDSPLTRINNIPSVHDAGSNVVRLQLNKNTRKQEIEGALLDIVERDMVAMLTLSDSSLTCKDDDNALADAVKQLWLGDWLEVIAQDRFQPYLMVNIAHQWGPNGVFTDNTSGYGDYLEAHKLAIRQFRKAGLKFPLVIDAAGCGQDYYSFTAGRARELRAADELANLVLSVHGFGEVWNTDDRVRAALTQLEQTNMPIVMSSFGGSGVAGESDVNHLGIIKKGMGDGGLVFNIPWQSAEDKAAYAINLDEPLYLRGGSIRTDLYLPKAYKDDGKLGIVIYLKDSAGRYANTGWSQASNLEQNAWNRLNFKLTSVEYLTGLGAYVEEGFDLGSVQTIGYEIVANGKAASVAAKLVFDNLTVFPGIPPAYQAGFDSDTQEWDLDWGPLTVGHTDGSLSILPTGAGDGGINLQGWKAPSFYQIPLAKPIDVSLRVYVPASYAGDADLGMKIYGKDKNWGWVDGPSTSLAGSAGAWSNVKLRVNFTGSEAPHNAFGIQFYGLAGVKSEPILIDSIEITDPSQTNTKVINAMQLGSSFDGDADSYGVIWDKFASSAVVDGALEITNTNTSGTADVAVGKGDIANKQLNLAGPVTVKVKVFVPESFAGSDFYFQLFMQDSTWSNNMVWRWDLADLTLGEWNELERTSDDFPAGFVRTGGLNNFVIQFGGAVNGTIKVDDVQIWGDVEVEDAQPIMTEGFEAQNAVDKVRFDYAQGGLSESVLNTVDAKAYGHSTRPFGWIAQAWIGAGGYDLSLSESAVDLTDRGEEIVSAEGGLATIVPPLAQ